GGAEEAGLHRGLLAAGPLTIVVVTDNHPWHSRRLVGPRDLWHRHILLAGQVVAGRPGLAGIGVDRTGEHVVADVIEVPTEAEPRPGGRDVVRRALALRLEQDGRVQVVVAVPRREGLDELEPLTVRVHLDLGVA